MNLKNNLSNFLFWLDRKYYAQDKYYKIYQSKTDSLHFDGVDHSEYGLPFEIIKGEFKGVVFCFKKLAFHENGEITFDYHIIKRSSRFRDKQFQKISRKIMLNILHKVIVGNGGLQLGLRPGEEYEDRNNYPEESYSERTIQQKSSSLSEK